MRPHGDRFDHNLHALHIVEQFEQRYLDFPGLNLTFEVREGIIKHHAITIRPSFLNCQSTARRAAAAGKRN